MGIEIGYIAGPVILLLGYGLVILMFKDLTK